MAIRGYNLYFSRSVIKFARALRFQNGVCLWLLCLEADFAPSLGKQESNVFSRPCYHNMCLWQREYLLKIMIYVT